MDELPPDRYTVGRRLLGQTVKKRREACGLTMRELAERSGLGFDSIASLETGRRLPSLQTLDGLAVALSTSAADLLRDAWPWDGTASPPAE